MNLMFMIFVCVFCLEKNGPGFLLFRFTGRPGGGRGVMTQKGCKSLTDMTLTASLTPSNVAKCGVHASHRFLGTP